MQKCILVKNEDELDSDGSVLNLKLRAGWRIISVTDSARLRCLFVVLDEPAGESREAKEKIIAVAVAEHQAQMRVPPASEILPTVDAPPRDPKAPAAYVPFAMTDDAK